MSAIPLDQVTWHHAWTGADPFGRLFEWRGELYRAIKAPYRSVYVKLVESGLAQHLAERGLLTGTEPTSYALDGYEWVVRHTRLSFVSYPFEWPGPMLRDAALMMVDLSLELSDADLFIGDPDFWNVLFDGCKPVFIDLCSIRALDTLTASLSPWPVYEYFCQYVLYPLYLIADGHERIVRSLLRDAHPAVTPSEFQALHGRSSHSLRTAASRKVRELLANVHEHAPSVVRPLLKASGRVARELAARGPASAKARRAFLEQVRQEVEAIRLPSSLLTERSRGDETVVVRSGSPVLGQTGRYVERVLERCLPQRVVDVNCDEGRLARLAASRGCTVVAVDADAAKVATLYEAGRASGLSILPLVLDVASPSPAYGVCNSKYAAATERLRADLVLALDVVHHLVLRRTLTFEHIVEALSQFTGRWLLVEFVAGDDPAGYPNWREWYAWYSWENFLKALSVQFLVLEVMATELSTRRLVLCEKRLAQGASRAREWDS